MKQLSLILIIAFIIAVPNSQANGVPNESALYKWYVEHYTGLDLEDLAKMKEAWDHNPNMAKDPNVKFNQGVYCK